jgi:hypothetical protein
MRDAVLDFGLLYFAFPPKVVAASTKSFCIFTFPTHPATQHTHHQSHQACITFAIFHMSRIACKWYPDALFSMGPSCLWTGQWVLLAHGGRNGQTGGIRHLVFLINCPSRDATSHVFDLALVLKQDQVEWFQIVSKRYRKNNPTSALQIFIIFNCFIHSKEL